MADDSKYVIPCPDQKAVDDAIRQAREMLDGTVRRMKTTFSVPLDPRLGDAGLRDALMGIFKVAPGDPSLRPVFEIKQNIGYLAEALGKMRVLCVSAMHPMSGKQNEMGHDGFAYIGTDRAPTIYLCPSFFNKQKQARARGRTIVHELAHGRLGVEHAGGQVLNFEDEAYLNLRSYDQAIANAYAYDAFVDYASRSASTPNRAAAGRR